jgi:hypothetical protein
VHIAYIGNFEPEHSTENEVRRALTNNEHGVTRFQEGDPVQLDFLIDYIQHDHQEPIKVILWTRTASKAALSGEARYWKLLAAARKAGVPVVGYHLDRWWGLARQSEIADDPFFQVDLLCTADGGHQPEWEAAGVNHVWFPPAISERHCRLGTPREEYASDIAFVGSWQGGYHPEDVYRPALINWLKRNYDRRVKFWPEPGQHAIRGDDLTDLYASVKVVVGTSCLAPKVDGSPMDMYCSDRCPETIGRGGLLLHPHVEGVTGKLFRHHWWKLDDLNELGSQIELLLAEPEDVRRAYAAAAQDHVRETATYEVRVRELIALLNERGML